MSKDTGVKKGHRCERTQVMAWRGSGSTGGIQSAGRVWPAVCTTHSRGEGSGQGPQGRERKSKVRGY